MNPSMREARVRALKEEYQQKFGMTLRDWLIYHQREIVFTECSYMGIPTLKNPMDAWVYQEIIHRVHPEVIVEIGSAAGGSTLYLAHLLRSLGHGVVVSVDRDRSDFRSAEENIIKVTGDSSSPETVGLVADHCQDKTSMVIHDGDHSYAAVLRELSLYSPLVSLGSYFVVEDGIVDLFEGDEMSFVGPGPLHAIVEFLENNQQFEVDQGFERYLLTYNPYGFLRRVR